jgi:hypothetical protein
MKETKVKDYNTVNDLLKEIKSKIDESTTSQKGGEATSNQTGALQNPNLPTINVPSLNNPPNPTPPPAVEENPEAVLPQISPEVTPGTP